ncbi:glycine betaine/L-proline ABC transporter ATP-binding protein [Desulfoluna limicola]|uniref:Glycine betaine/L-proline ABC transporter ATP-binding protein n=1 Tax=Desulfoluna limicola TaxID=2810562 RepID=A0ABN6F4X0_9BACT|nr:glycine betaine/L-proline ABC transporter ATP-binding protein ProV [Desulfoluna limicola]BCS97038.1 glycine betaine/L-proline ABC transporter ATP-binding protein [Desulfoluna limicola]
MSDHAEPLDKIVVQDLYKIFGSQPKKALALLAKGENKDAIFEKTGMTVGVQGASFSVKEGEIFVVMGLSGSGKSTLVRMLNRLMDPTSGKVLLDGEDVTTMDDEALRRLRRNKMSMVFQSFALMPHLTVVENVALGLEFEGVAKEDRLSRSMEALEQVGLSAWAESFPADLSGGMQQRVGLARSLAVNPDVLLMDEAFSALDPLIRTEMQDELLRLQEEHKRTVVFISHDLDEAMRIGDRIAIMEGGRVIQVGTPEEILQNPENEYVRAFFRGVDPTQILTAGDIVRNTQVTLIRHPGHGPRAAMSRLSNQDRDYGYVLDARKRFVGVVSTDSLKEVIDLPKGERDITDAFLEGAESVNVNESMQEILPMITANPWPVPVTDDEDRYLGVVSRNMFLKSLQRPDISPSDTTDGR